MGFSPYAPGVHGWLEERGDLTLSDAGRAPRCTNTLVCDTAHHSVTTQYHMQAVGHRLARGDIFFLSRTVPDLPTDWLPESTASVGSRSERHQVLVYCTCTNVPCPLTRSPRYPPACCVSRTTVSPNLQGSDLGRRAHHLGSRGVAVDEAAGPCMVSS